MLRILGQAPNTAGGLIKHMTLEVISIYHKNVKIQLASISPNNYAKSEKSESGR